MPTEFELKLDELRNCMVVVAFHEIVAAHNADIAALEAERDALRKDAERYRWLRDAGFYELPYDNHGAGPEFAVTDELDRQIDAAIAAKEPANGQG